MLIEFFKKAGKSKWLPWVGISPVILFLLVTMLKGEVSRGAGLFLFFGSIWAGVILGAKLALFISTHLLNASESLKKRLTAAFSVFGFLFFPVLIGSFTNASLGTNIEMHSVEVHFLWACVGAGIAFLVSPEKAEKSH